MESRKILFNYEICFLSAKFYENNKLFVLIYDNSGAYYIKNYFKMIQIQTSGSFYQIGWSFNELKLIARIIVSDFVMFDIKSEK